MKRTRTEYAILAIALMGLILSLYAITLHYAPSSSSFCNITANWNCDKVNKSPWATFFGIPVSILGLLAYLSVFLITLKRRAILRWLAFTEKDYAGYFLLFAAAMLLFQLYLTGVEAFIIGAYCIVCLGSQLLTLLLVYLGWRQHAAADMRLPSGVEQRQPVGDSKELLGARVRKNGRIGEKEQ